MCARARARVCAHTRARVCARHCMCVSECVFVRARVRVSQGGGKSGKLKSKRFFFLLLPLFVYIGYLEDSNYGRLNVTSVFHPFHHDPEHQLTVLFGSLNN